MCFTYVMKLDNISDKKKSLDEAKRKRKKKDYMVGLNRVRTNEVKVYLKTQKEKVSFSELMDYLLKQFYNQFKDQIKKAQKEEIKKK